MEVRLEWLHDDDICIQVHSAIMPQRCESQNLCDVTEEVRARPPLLYVKPPVLGWCALNQSLCVRSLDDDIVAQVPKRLKVIFWERGADDDDTRVGMEAQSAFDRSPVPKSELLCLCRPCEEEVRWTPSSVLCLVWVVVVGLDFILI